MLLLPIVDRELRVAARNWRTYFARVTSGLAALGVAFYLIWIAQQAMGGAWSGMFILKSTAYIAWAVCLFGGIHRTCDSLSSEKREDTLGLLFLTHLKGYDVVLGKLMANGLSSFFLLLGLLPILSIPILLGGVSGTELIRIPLVLLNSLFFACAIGLFVSSFTRSQRVATALGGGVVVFLGLLLPGLAHLVEQESEFPEMARWLRIPSPLCTVEMSFASTLGLSNNDFWKSLGVQFSLALLALLAACWIAPRSWRVQSSPWAKGLETFERWTHGSASARVRRRGRMLARNPFFWLAYRDLFAPAWPILFCAGLFGVTLWCIFHYAIDKGPAFALMLAAVAVNDLMIRTRVSSLGSGQLGQDRHSGALEMVMSTPLTVDEVMKGVWMAIRHIQLPAYGLLFLVYVIVAGGFLLELDRSIDHLIVFFLFALVSIGDFIVLGYVAMWKGMEVANPRHSAGATMIRVVIVPWFLWLGLLPLVNQVKPLRLFFDATEPYSYAITALVIWGVSSGRALVKARRNLRAYFREALTDRYQFETRFNIFRRLSRYFWTSLGAQSMERAVKPYPKAEEAR